MDDTLGNGDAYRVDWSQPIVNLITTHIGSIGSVLTNRGCWVSHLHNAIY